MCGRYALVDTPSKLTGVFEEGDEIEPVEGLTPRYNAAPTDRLPVVLDEDGPRLALWRWGLVPASSKTGPKGRPLINVPSEQVQTRFRRAFEARRVLVPMTGFYEWTADKQPFLFRDPGGALLVAAGLWASWDGPDGPLRSFTILTTRPTGVVAALHDRMPVLIPPHERRRWLDPSADPAGLTRLFDVDVPLVRVAVSRRVNSVKNDDPSVLVADS